MVFSSDTICALATPNGSGAIGIIRISGAKAIEITEQFFSKKLANQASHTIHFGTFRDTNQSIVDEVLVSIFKEGKSFTGEESVEISCHGSSYILQQILALLTQAGCRLAEPGEFTQRAFMNGKLDLSQAEAVADLIASQSRQSHQIALRQLRGNFSHELKDLRSKLIHFASLIELELDFAEEDVEFADRSELRFLVDEVLAKVQRLEQSFALGNALKNGVPVAIVGAPNTGKSTLLNQLLGEERAIVSSIQGTTRDVIEETLNIDGILFRLIDTAGIRDTSEVIESLGIERSLQKIEQAQIVLLMSDAGDHEKTDENHASMRPEEALSWAQQISSQYPDKKIIVLANKVDLRTSSLVNPIVDEVELITISAKSGLGIDELKSKLVESVTADFDLSNETIVSNTRHLEQLNRTADNLIQAKRGLVENVTGDFIAMDIRAAMRHLGNITGEIEIDKDILGNIFAHFCIGK